MMTRNQLNAYQKGKQMKEATLKANWLAPRHPENIAQFEANPWTLTALAQKEAKSLLKAMEDNEKEASSPR